MNAPTPLSTAAFFAAAVLLATATGRDAWSESASREDDPPLQTRILRINVQPDPVPVSETATITVSIADSTDERFEFYWHFSAGSKGDATNDNTVEWTAPDKPGEHTHAVTARRGGTSNPPPSASFKITVVEKN